MTFKESIQELLENLVKATLSGQLTWVPVGTSNTKVETVVDDVLFSFHINWKLELENGWTLSKGWITMKDSKSNFEFTIYGFNFPELLSQLHDYLCDIHFNNLHPSDQPIIDRVNELTRKVSLQEFRDTKIDKILD